MKNPSSENKGKKKKNFKVNERRKITKNSSIGKIKQSTIKRKKKAKYKYKKMESGNITDV